MQRRALLVAKSILIGVTVGCIAAGPASAATSRTLAVKAPVVLGFTDMQGERIESVSLVEGRPFKRGAMELRGTLADGVSAGRFAIYDGRGVVRGHSRAVTMDGSRFEGTFTVDGGSGRYARATGKLHFAGALDTDSVPGVVVLPGKLAGKLHVRPAPPKPAFSKPVSVDRRGKGAKLRFRQVTTDPFFAKLTSGFATALTRFGNGVFIETDDVRADTRLRPKVLTWFGADGTWSAKGTTSLDTGPDGSDPLKVTGGTGRYRGAHGKIGYTLLTDPATSGVQIARLRGRLRFR